MSNYRILADEDIIGDDDKVENEDEGMAEAAAVPDKWKRLEADLKRIRDRETKSDELSSLRKKLEESELAREAGDAAGLSKRE